jgi:hypothetical protein
MKYFHQISLILEDMEIYAAVHLKKKILSKNPKTQIFDFEKVKLGVGVY